jgi:hypothetical protein
VAIDSGVASTGRKELRRIASHVQILRQKARHVPQSIPTSAEISRTVNRHLHKLILAHVSQNHVFPDRTSSSTEFLPTILRRTSVLSSCDYRTAQMKRTIVYVSVHTDDY